MTTSGERIPCLDGFRAIAITLVIGGHSFSRWLSTFDTGSLGVSLFFIISGYLITSLLLREIERAGHINLLQFYVRRCRDRWSPDGH